MNTPTKVAGFALGLAAVFAITLGVGNAVGEVTEPTRRSTKRPTAAVMAAPKRPRPRTSREG